MGTLTRWLNSHSSDIRLYIIWNVVGTMWWTLHTNYVHLVIDVCVHSKIMINMFYRLKHMCLHPTWTETETELDYNDSEHCSVTQCCAIVLHKASPHLHRMFAHRWGNENMVLRNQLQILGHITLYHKSGLDSSIPRHQLRWRILPPTKIYTDPSGILQCDGDPNECTGAVQKYAHARYKMTSYYLQIMPCGMSGWDKVGSVLALFASRFCKASSLFRCIKACF